MQKHFRNILRLWKILEPFHLYFYIQLGLIFIGQIFILGFAYISSALLNNLVSKNIQVITLYFILWIILMFIDVLVDYVSRINREKHLNETLYSYLQEFSFKQLLNLTIAQHIEDHSALKYTIIQKGETSTKTIIDQIITVIVPTITLITITLITLFFYSTAIGITSVIAMILIFIYTYFVNKKRYPLIVKNRENWNANNRFRGESFTHMQLVKYLSREDSFIKKYLLKRIEVVRYHLFVRIQAIRLGQGRALLTEISSLATLGIAGYFFLQGAYSVGTIYLIWSITTRVYNQASNLSNTVRELPFFYTEAEKYLEIIDMEPSFKEKGLKVKKLNGDVILQNVSFTYPKGDSPVLNNISLIIPEGKHTAFVGSSGSGKSTIIKLLLRAYDYTIGSIKIGNTELKKIDAGSLRELMGYVEQHVDLFDDSIKENILIGVSAKKRKLAEKNLETIAQKARIDQFYHRLGEKKFDTMVGERGIKLSGGERQRVGIARAIIKDPEILIFDEATSSLDSENEKYVMEAINDVSRGKTTIIIAHRLSTVRNADKIIVMDKGKVVGEGTHEELLVSSPEYKNLVEHQLS